MSRKKYKYNIEREIDEILKEDEINVPILRLMLVSILMGFHLCYLWLKSLPYRFKEKIKEIIYD